MASMLSCGTCTVHVTSGQTHMVHNGGIREDEVEEGHVLACCTQPIGTIEVEV
ncbi:2Fe-2S iron-sulfur cluster-binding protein [Thalassobaculum salexigens]|uniref:2Fe-2S iron-sulfur cluster-binding protein n=1 Tax=Thalassobaculum salexigens TaxID=455360 RepID=UPI000A07BDEF